MHSAAGGTSQRLKPALAIVRSRSRKPAPAPEILPALSIVVMHSSPAAALLSKTAATLQFLSPLRRSRPCCSAQSPDTRQDRHAHLKTLTPRPGLYARYDMQACVPGPLLRASRRRLNRRGREHKVNW